MFDKVEIYATSITPEIHLDLDKKEFYFEGVSRPENALIFYEPVINWLKKLEDHCQTKNLGPLQFEFSLEYINSVSIKLLFDCLQIISAIQKRVGQVSIKWNYRKGDADMKEMGEEYSKLIQVPFEFQQYE